MYLIAVLGGMILGAVLYSILGKANAVWLLKRSAKIALTQKVVLQDSS